MSKVGYIKDWRQELESDIWLMPPMYHRVWQWIKYSVNHSPGRIPNSDGTVTIINPGQHATSYRLIAQGVGYYERGKWVEPNVKTIKSILDWLVAQGMIMVKSNTYGTLITVVKWELYQTESIESNTQVTLGKHSLDTKKNDKECNKNISIYSIFDSYSENADIRQALRDYSQMRNKIKAPLTERAVTLLLNKLDALASTDDLKIKLLEQAIMSNWKSVYPLKEEKQQKPKTNKFHNFMQHEYTEGELEAIAQKRFENKIKSIQEGGK